MLQRTTCWRDDSHRLKLEYRLPWIARDILCRFKLLRFSIICRTVRVASKTDHRCAIIIL